MVQHDFNPGHRLHDLNLVRDGRRFGAVEVTMAADKDATEVWRNASRRDGRWIEAHLAGGWAVRVHPTAHVKTLRRELPSLLRELEAGGVREFGSGLRHRRDPYRHHAERLGIAHARQGGTEYPGSIYLLVRQSADRVSGIVANTGDALAEWVSEWVADPVRADNLEKLAKSGADERHLFVVLPDFADAPFGVFDLLTRDAAPLPTISPVLPPEVTHLWVLSVWTTADGVRWSPDGRWSHFPKPLAATGDRRRATY